MRVVSSFVSGLLFALGLGVSGMTDPKNVVGFLDVSGAWNPALAFVMAGALAVYAVAYRLVQRRGRPAFDAVLHLPEERRVTTKLVLGALIFGAGWGLSGYCPGPALVSLGALASNGGASVAFVAAMVASAGLTRILSHERDLAPEARVEAAHS